MNKTNKRFGGWPNEGMKRYDEIAKVVKSDRKLNHPVEHQFKDFMMRKIYGHQTNVPQIIPIQVLSNRYSSLGNEYLPYNKFETLTRIDTKQTNVKNIYSDSIVSNTDKCDIKHTRTLIKNVPNTDKSIIKHAITLT